MPNDKEFAMIDDERNNISENLRKYSDKFFDNLIWLTSEEAAFYIRKSVGALRTMVSRGHIKCKKWKRRLYFLKDDLDRLLESSTDITGGLYGG